MICHGQEIICYLKYTELLKYLLIQILIPPNPGIAEALTTGATFQINNAKLYVPVVTVSMNDNIMFLEHLKQGFRRTVSWNKCRYETRTEQKTKKNLDCMMDPTFRNINLLFFHSKMVTMILQQILLVNISYH